MTPRIQQAWDSYLQAVVPVGAPAVQLTECKRAFFAGAAAAFDVFTAIGDDAVSEDEGVTRLEELSQEMQAFVATVGTERELEIRSGGQ